MRAEINLNEPFGYEIFQTVVKYDLRKNLEIGSWDGEGSTTCFVEAMKLLSGKMELQCIEIVHEKAETLRQRFSNVDFVKVFNGSSISYDSLIYKDFEEIWNSPFNKIRKELYSKELVKSWYDRDIETIKNSISFFDDNITVCENVEIEEPVEELPPVKSEPYDAVLIDGGEFTGYSEFLYIEHRTKFLFLDDVHHAFKCYEIYDKLKNDDKWQLVSENPDVRNGFAIFRNKNKV